MGSINPIVILNCNFSFARHNFAEQAQLEGQYTHVAFLRNMSLGYLQLLFFLLKSVSTREKIVSLLYIRYSLENG